MSRARLWYSGLAERERRLLMVLGATFAILLLGFVPYLIVRSMGEKREAIDSLRAAIEAVQSGRQQLEQAKAQKKSTQERYANTAPALAGFIENAARKNGLEIPESQDRPDQPHGKRFVEHSTVVRMRKVGLAPLVQMLEQLENAGHPVSVSRLQIRRRGREADSYDVELGVSAFETHKPSAEEPSPKGAPSSSTP